MVKKRPDLTNLFASTEGPNATEGTRQEGTKETEREYVKAPFYLSAEAIQASTGCRSSSGA